MRSDVKVMLVLCFGVPLFGLLAAVAVVAVGKVLRGCAPAHSSPLHDAPR